MMAAKWCLTTELVTESFQLSCPSTWGREGDGGECVFFSICMTMRWIERAHDGKRERQRQIGMLMQVHTGCAISPKKDNIV